jgi:hypothetical protein
MVVGSVGILIYGVAVGDKGPLYYSLLEACSVPLDVLPRE